MEFIEKILSSTNIFYFVIAIIIIYGAIHQYRVDLLIKKHQINLKFGAKLFLFRFPYLKNKYDLDSALFKKIKYIAKEYFFIHLIIFLYLFSVIGFYLLQAYY